MKKSVSCGRQGSHQCPPVQVSLSSEVMQMVKMVPRGFTATADAYLTPHIMRWAPPLLLSLSYCCKSHAVLPSGTISAGAARAACCGYINIIGPSIRTHN